MPAPEGNTNAVGHENPRAGKRGHALMMSLPYEEYQAFRDACELQAGKLLNNGEFDELLRKAFRQGVRAIIEAPKPEPRWEVLLFWDGDTTGKLLKEVSDLPEEEAFNFAMSHKNVVVDGHLCNRIIARQQGSRTNERHWSARHESQYLTWRYEGTKS